MSQERDVKLLVANELHFSREAAKAAEMRTRNIWTAIRDFSYRHFNRAKMDEISDTFDGNTALLEICLEENDVHELKRLTVAMELFENEIICLAFIIVLVKALQVILE